MEQRGNLDVGKERYKFDTIGSSSFFEPLGVRVGTYSPALERLLLQRECGYESKKFDPLPNPSIIF
jgi:hypothetical protein